VSADLLRRAANVLREHAETAQNKQPWCPEYTWSAVRHVQRNCDFLECGYHGADHDAQCHSFDMYDGRYVAMMHPPVALALADWLEANAEWMTDNYPSPGGRTQLDGLDDAAVAVARAILREAS
jgi:hypothetical protein